MEEITSCCNEFVIGGSDKEPVRRLARGSIANNSPQLVLIRITHYDRY